MKEGRKEVGKGGRKEGMKKHLVGGAAPSPQHPSSSVTFLRF